MLFDNINYPAKERLSKAREHETSFSPYNKEERPAFHLIARNGWMNDPNGFSEYGGSYHLFYQYYPYAAHWDSMHWGHAKSKDLIRWEYLPCALAPDQSYDSFGVFSGSAITLGEDHVLMYTGVEAFGKELTPEGFHNQRQTQCIAIGDGVDYEKLSENPVICPEDIPDCMIQDFRDPKIWKEGDTCYAIMAARNKDHQGMLPVCCSKDLRHWEYCGTVFTNDDSLGNMVECPDYFPLKDFDHPDLPKTDVLLTSVISLKGDGLRIPSGPGVIYLQGKLAPDKSDFKVEHLEMLDYGFDFYASHSLQAKDGRCILTAWMSNLQSIIAPVAEKWCGMLAFPRELCWKNDRIYQLPVRELCNYYTDTVSYGNLLLCDSKMTALPGIKGRMLDLTVTIKEGDYESFAIHLAADKNFRTTISYDPAKKELTYDRSQSGTAYPRIPYQVSDHIRTISVAPVKGLLTLRILMDRFSTELFVNEGEKVMTCMTETPQEADGIFFESKGNAEISVTKHSICVR